eukprot:gnl/TRDRNA2_/TRDRNA2_99500_c1_seq2.p1 gnl/TRDRNA2_/TRDRNA2_99500_c1~~gnl/TRDRNA2_/TRDRNA2_99500_c1_seq2.p1  ORF type:complete len:388 (-),score=39.48 gnl/TRDRNA2_/TRDRNA2_99500_c1_seq2:5-1084(-)
MSTQRFSEMTLLFQPDCRIFCINGPDCRFLQGPRGAEHGRHMLHQTYQVVRAAAAEALEKHGRATVANAPAGTTISIPYVRECWAIGAEPAGTNFPPALVGRRVVVYVHGFRQRFYPILNAGSHLLHRIREAGAGGPVVLTFVWPACRNPLQYATAREKASEAGARLQSLLRLLQHHGCRSMVIGHSMGCRVSLLALRSEPAVADAGILCEHLMLLSAAVPANALAATGDFPRDCIAAAEISVVSSQRDDVLRDRFAKGEAMATFQMPIALGFSGPELPCPRNVTHLDVSETVAGHGVNAVFQSHGFQQLLQMAAGLPALPTDEASEASWSSLRQADEEAVSSIDEADRSDTDEELGTL